MHPPTVESGPNTPRLARYATTLAEYGHIAPLKNLEDDRTYIFSGTWDEIITTTVVNQTREFFKAVGIPEASIRYDKSIAAGHAFLTDDNTDTACALTRAPCINDCDFSQAGAILEQIHQGLKSPARHRDDSLIAFDHKEFIDSPYTSMDDTAYAYVPTACQSDKSCPVHVVFHGCWQGSRFTGDQYYARTGYNRLAEANNLIMLYPQVRPSSASPLNPDGCWDFWGYSSLDSPTPDYFTRNAPQLRAIHKMIARLAEPHPEPIHCT
ncbi:poly(3-hydroxybutyrate) depolymerase [Azorhizophilus paspali]